jgi:hypothetical protein
MMKRSVLVCGFVLVCCVGWIEAGDWSQFRGTNNDGIVADSAIPSEWGPDKNVLWKTKIPGVAWSSPIVWGEKVFVTTAVTDNQKKPQAGGGFGGGGGGGGGFGGGGPGGFAPPVQPGQILNPFLQGMLNLTDEQKKELDAFQKEVDGKIEKILTDEQKKQVKEMQEAGARRGPPGGFGGPGRGGPDRKSVV